MDGHREAIQLHVHLVLVVDQVLEVLHVSLSTEVVRSVRYHPRACHEMYARNIPRRRMVTNISPG